MAKSRPTSAPARISPRPSRPRKQLLILGGGGHGVVVTEAASLSGWRIGGILDDRPDSPATRDFKRLGPLFPTELVISLINRSALFSFIVCVGDTGIRRRVLESMVAVSDRAATIVHPAAIVSPSATLGQGVFVGPGAVVHSRAVIGDHAIINTAAVIEHDCVVGENTHVAPGAIMAGVSRVGKDALVGVGARVLPGVSIGDGSTVGGGAVVISDVPSRVTVKGVPAR